ncbi:uncharacterized protein [Dysidea avara]|uniref:uncharacterized protein n=1 Tax=Dysidea avara TaxID=196820 RepID=UPI0033276E3B
MSRTEGFTLPRIPTSHARATSPTSIQPHLAQQVRKEPRHERTMTEPSYTSYLGTPRQDVPYHVYTDTAMYEDVFEKRGSFIKSPTHNISCPLSQNYNSLHDSHCRHLYLNNHKLREHLINLGLITEDLKIVSSTQQQRQKIRAHEMLERKELLLNRMKEKQTKRLSNLEVPIKLPKILSWSISREQERKQQSFKVKEAKRRWLQMSQRKEQQESAEKKNQESMRLKQLIEEQQVANEKRRKDEVNKHLARAHRNVSQGVEVAQWHRDAEAIKVRMKKLEKEVWSRKKSATVSAKYGSLDTSMSSIGEANMEVISELNSSLARVKFGKVDVITSRESTTISEKDDHHGDDELQHQETTVVDSEPITGENELVDTTEKDQASSPVAEMVTDEKKEDGVEGVADAVTDAVTDTAIDGDIEKVTETADSTPQEVAETTDRLPDVAEQEPPPAEALTAEESVQIFAAILLEQLSIYDQAGNGYLTTQEFLQVLTSRQLGLRLNNDEMQDLIVQLDPNNSGWTVYGDVVYELATMLLQLVTQNTLQDTGLQPVEYYWSQLSSPTYGYLYLNRTSGQIQRGRPEEFRPFLKDNIFEDSIVDFFETSDVNQDGLVDRNEFYQLLVSHDVGQRLFPPQVEQLTQSFEQQLSMLPANERAGLNLEEFCTVARALITFVYRNTFPSADDWIELDSPKVGRFWLNKLNGETRLHDQSLLQDEPAQDSMLNKSLATATLSSALPTIAEGPSDEEADTPAANQHKHITATTDPHSDNAVHSDSSDKTHQRKHKRKSKRKRSEKAIAPPPLRPRSRPSSQQSGTKSEGASSGGVTEGLTHAGTPDRKQSTNGNNKESQPDDKADEPIVTATESTSSNNKPTDDVIHEDVVHNDNKTDGINMVEHNDATNNVTDTEATDD